MAAYLTSPTEREITTFSLPSVGNTARKLKEQPSVMPVEKPVKRPVNRRVMGLLRPRVVACILAVCVMAALLIESRLSLYRTEEQLTDLKAELSELQTQRELLRGQYDSSIDYRAIEEKAILEYGMSKPTSGQVVYLNLSEGDHGEVLNGKDTIFSDLSEAVREVFRNLGSYFAEEQA